MNRAWKVQTHTWARAFVAFVAMLVVLSPAAVGQETPATRLVGVVLEPNGAGLEGVQILFHDTELVALTDNRGHFRVDGVGPGVYSLTFFKSGYELHRYRYVFPDRLEPEIDLGAVVLKPVQESLTTLMGSVVDSGTADPVVAAQLSLDDEPAGLADETGSFQLEGVTAGFHTLAVRRIGYQPMFVDLEIPVGHPQIDLVIKMNPLPTDLPEVVVEAEAPFGSSKLRRFWKRSQLGVGHFITAFDIAQRKPRVPTDMLEFVPGLFVRRDVYGNNRVELARPVQGCSSPTYFLDGARVGPRDIDATVDPRSIAGIEVYTRSSQIPSEFNTRGEPGCGVVAVWMR
jgi:hypothetical protein